MSMHALHRLPSRIAPRIIRHHAVPDWIETSRADYRAVTWGRCSLRESLSHRLSVDRARTHVYHDVYTFPYWKRLAMAARKKTKIFMSGNSQAVRIPREFQLEGDEVEIQRRGNTLVIRPKKQTWQLLLDSLPLFTDDFMEGGRQQPPVQKRKPSFT